MSLDMSIKEKESLIHEQETTLRTTQTQEGRVLELTNEIAKLVREKEVVEENARQLQREIAIREREMEDMRVKMETLQGQTSIHKGWMKEREVTISVCIYIYISICWLLIWNYSTTMSKTPIMLFLIMSMCQNVTKCVLNAFVCELR